MSAERDVVFFLMKHKILDIIQAIIADCKNPRLMVCKLLIIIQASALIATKALSVRMEDPNIILYILIASCYRKLCLEYLGILHARLKSGMPFQNESRSLNF